MHSEIYHLQDKQDKITVARINKTPFLIIRLSGHILHGNIMFPEEITKAEHDINMERIVDFNCMEYKYQDESENKKYMSITTTTKELTISWNSDDLDKIFLHIKSIITKYYQENSSDFEPIMQGIAE